MDLSNPALVLLVDVPAAGLDSIINPLTACGRDSLAVEDDQGHLNIVSSVITTCSLHRYPHIGPLLICSRNIQRRNPLRAGFLNHWMERLLSIGIGKPRYRKIRSSLQERERSASLLAFELLSIQAEGRGVGAFGLPQTYTRGRGGERTPGADGRVPFSSRRGACSTLLILPTNPESIR